MLVHVIADYGHNDLAFAEVTIGPGDVPDVPQACVAYVDGTAI